eukprot:gnl/TRDRNA2_/TRDRNA2_93753_c0_seq1.p1 gnl/TRDRNA2_/TRDRNA2_93753_c0~~gnl/TRDRNA2_/TRDRNA2_93753_c0_seq1.p1  ORF type:complete len:414 (-),score=69.41 gnl/TRDRNA2_/TRDRNA2_93753_c0_seq1:2-1243(-)
MKKSGSISRNFIGKILPSGSPKGSVQPEGIVLDGRPPKLETAPAPEVTIALIGPPGEGKSTLGNLLVRGFGTSLLGEGGALPFRSSESFDAQGFEISQAEFVYEGIRHMVVDATGLLDSAPKTAERLPALTRVAPHGVDAYVFVLRKGRFTDDISGQLTAFEDAAGGECLKRTVVVFTHCGLETNEMLRSRCLRSANGALRDTMQRTAAIVGVDCLAPARAQEDRMNVLAATAGVCRAHRTKHMVLDPAELQRAIRDLEYSVRGLSGERQVAMQAKIDSLVSGYSSLDAVRQALRQAQERQLAEDIVNDDYRVLEYSVCQAQNEANSYRDATLSMLDRPTHGRGHGADKLPPGWSCCNPVAACHTNPCVTCEDGVAKVIDQYRNERRKDIESRFAAADARSNEPRLDSDMGSL